MFGRLRGTSVALPNRQTNWHFKFRFLRLRSTSLRGLLAARASLDAGSRRPRSAGLREQRRVAQLLSSASPGQARYQGRRDLIMRQRSLLDAAAPAITLGGFLVRSAGAAARKQTPKALAERS